MCFAESEQRSLKDEVKRLKSSKTHCRRSRELSIHNSLSLQLTFVLVMEETLTPRGFSLSETKSTSGALQLGRYRGTPYRSRLPSKALSMLVESY